MIIMRAKDDCIKKLGLELEVTVVIREVTVSVAYCYSRRPPVRKQSQIFTRSITAMKVIHNQSNSSLKALYRTYV